MTGGAGPEPWPGTTHDWSRTVDVEHLLEVRRHPDVFAPGGAGHRVHEVVAYAADEAAAAGRQGRCDVTLHADGSVSVVDDGRGTDTRRDAEGRPVRKPVMATKDLRFFDDPTAERLPDGRPRRGMSVVAALSDCLVHENRRADGAWRQRYERGVPVTDLEPLEPDGTTGTAVRFRPRTGLAPVSSQDLARLAGGVGPSLVLVVHDLRPLS